MALNVTVRATGPDEVTIIVANRRYDLTPAEAHTVATSLQHAAEAARRQSLGRALADRHNQYANQEV